MLVVLAGAIVASFAWLCVYDPNIAFLPGDNRAEWMLFPTVPNAGLHPVTNLDVFFKREFTLDGQPQMARLLVRANKRVQLAINSRPVSINPGTNWKDIMSADVPACLLAGTNLIEATVSNDNGPPALWLALSTDRLTLRSDSTWKTSLTGSTWRYAILASTPKTAGTGNPMAGGESTFAALARVWPTWMIFAGLSMALWAAGQWWFNRMSLPNSTIADRFSRREMTVLLIFVAAFWVALFGNNMRSLSLNVGFDARAHVDYIRYIQNHRALPLPNEGWETFQPPLYYSLSAVILSSFGLSVADEAARIILRVPMMLLGIAHFALVFMVLRQLFPRQIARQLVGLALAAFLPMNLYMAHYVTNEMMAATLATMVIFLCFRLLQAEKTTMADCALLGLCMGMALLTKITCALLMPFIVAAVAGKLMSQPSSIVIWLRTLGMMLTICLAVCAWYYIWIWFHFGKPFIGNWDADSGFRCWQDNGYHMITDFTRFGRSLVNPLFSGFGGFADGIYSTLWGDGLCGGSRSVASSPPWNYNLMCAGYLLAMLPTALILIGAVASIWSFIHKPSAALFVLLGFSGAVVVALMFINLKIPSYAEAKAFYGLCALVPLCFFGAVGWDVLTRGRKSIQFALGIILLVWALNSFATFWIRKDSPSIHAHPGIVSNLNGNTEAELAEFLKAVA